MPPVALPSFRARLPWAVPPPARTGAVTTVPALAPPRPTASEVPVVEPPVAVPPPALVVPLAETAMVPFPPLPPVLVLVAAPVVVTGLQLWSLL